MQHPVEEVWWGGGGVEDASDHMLQGVDARESQLKLCRSLILLRGMHTLVRWMYTAKHHKNDETHLFASIVRAMCLSFLSFPVCNNLCWVYVCFVRCVCVCVCVRVCVCAFMCARALVCDSSSD